MSKRYLHAAAFLLSATAASADQYAIETSASVDVGSSGLQQALRIRPLDSFDAGGRSFTIIEAPSEAFVEAYIKAMHYRPLALYVLEADWNGAGLSSLPVAARSPFMLSAPCESCSS